VFVVGPIRAQTHEHHPAATDSSAHGAHEHHAMPADHGAMHAMTGMYGPYPMKREASGTAWQPDAGMHQGIHVMKGSWMMMLHGAADLVYDDQGGPRGGEKVFSNNMLMGMAQRPTGPGVLGARVMLSAEPATIGTSGYPLLLQTGETADGQEHLIDRQHPHDLFMELAGSYSISGGKNAAFLYGGLAGEPALGPPAFMHRFSGMIAPEAPITHHWLDSSHITFGVLTLGAIYDRLKLEASVFNGREPDQHRSNLEFDPLDSYSYRVSFNPSMSWSLQASYGNIHSPEQLDPEIDTERTTVSAMWAKNWDGVHAEAMLAWGRNDNQPGHLLDAYLAEAAAQLRNAHVVFGRYEWVEKDELFDHDDPRAGQVYEVAKLSMGYRLDFWRTQHVLAGVGALGSAAFVPAEIEGAFGERPLSAMVFGHVELH
jgi:hypothetical protein